MKKLYEEGEERIETNLDIVKIIRTLRDQKIVTKKLLNQKEIAKMISESHKVCINLDSDSDDVNLDKGNGMSYQNLQEKSASMQGGDIAISLEMAAL